MVDPIGTSLGVISLVIQLVDGVAQGYRFYIAASGMPDRCRSLRVRLDMEHNRLLDWVQAAGILEYDHGAPLPDILLTNKYVLVAILTQVRATMDEFAELNGRYEELGDMDDKETGNEFLKLSCATFSSFANREKQLIAKRKKWLSTDNVLRMVKKGKEIVMQPRRLRWVAFDEDIFKELLRKLSEYNDYLEGLLRGHQAKTLVESSRRSQLEMVSMRSSMEQLNTLVAAAMLMFTRTPTSGLIERGHATNEDTLACLAEFKTINISNDLSNPKHLLEYPDRTGQIAVSAELVEYTEPPTQSPPSGIPYTTRAQGTLTQGATATKIWIEWKAYDTRVEGEDLLPSTNHVARAKSLVTLMQMSKPIEFCIPHSLGFFDDAEGDRNATHPARFGLVFAVPATADPTIPPRSLLQMIRETDAPALDDRLKLAKDLATCVLYLHTVRWLHKAIRSDNIVFFTKSGSASGDSNLDLANPLLCGFEYARPDAAGATYTGSQTDDAAELTHSFYRHPDYEGSATAAAAAVYTATSPSIGANYRKTYDIYSLGIVLLEIAYWRPIWDILGLDGSATTGADEGVTCRRVRDDLAGSSGRSGYWGRVGALMGSGYAGACRVCVEGRAALGVGDAEDEMDVVVGVRLQREFIRLVVDPLGGILR